MPIKVAHALSFESSLDEEIFDQVPEEPELHTDKQKGFVPILRSILAELHGIDQEFHQWQWDRCRNRNLLNWVVVVSLFLGFIVFALIPTPMQSILALFYGIETLGGFCFLAFFWSERKAARSWVRSEVAEGVALILLGSAVLISPTVQYYFTKSDPDALARYLWLCGANGIAVFMFFTSLTVVHTYTWAGCSLIALVAFVAAEGLLVNFEAFNSGMVGLTPSLVFAMEWLVGVVIKMGYSNAGRREFELEMARFNHAIKLGAFARRLDQRNRQLVEAHNLGAKLAEAVGDMNIEVAAELLADYTRNSKLDPFLKSFKIIITKLESFRPFLPDSIFVSSPVGTPADPLSPIKKGMFVEQSPHVDVGLVKRQITVLRLEIIGFDKWAMNVPPAAVERLSTSLLDVFVCEVKVHRGAILMFSSSFMMASWGGVVSVPGHELAGCNAAFSLAKLSMSVLNRHTDTSYLKLRVAVTTGPALCGNIGNSSHKMFTARGSVIEHAKYLCSVWSDPITESNASLLPPVALSSSTPPVGSVRRRASVIINAAPLNVVPVKRLEPSITLPDMSPSAPPPLQTSSTSSGLTADLVNNEQSSFSSSTVSFEDALSNDLLPQLDIPATPVVLPGRPALIPTNLPPIPPAPRLSRQIDSANRQIDSAKICKNASVNRRSFWASESNVTSIMGKCHSSCNSMPDDFSRADVFVTADVMKVASHVYKVTKVDALLLPGQSGQSELDRCVYRIESFHPPGRWTHSNEVIGKGANGMVYLGRDSVTLQPVALKVQNISGTNEAAITKSLGEIALLVGLEHPNIVQYLGCEYLDDDSFVIALQYAARGSLLAKLNSEGPVSMSEVQCHARDIARGLAYLHGKGLSHRDIKPANVLVDSNGVAMLADFGSAKVDDAGTQTMIGRTVRFAAPEVMNNLASLPADVWGLGLTILQLATGLLPWSWLPETTLIHTLLTNSEDYPVPSWLPEPFRAFVCRCVQFRPEARPLASELINDPFFSVSQSQLTAMQETMRRARVHSELAGNASKFDESVVGGSSPLGIIAHEQHPAFQTFESLDLEQIVS